MNMTRRAFFGTLLAAPVAAAVALQPKKPLTGWVVYELTVYPWQQAIMDSLALNERRVITLGRNCGKSTTIHAELLRMAEELRKRGHTNVRTTVVC